jgi:hypothetical protein
MHIADRHLQKLSCDQVQAEVETIVRPGGAWGLHRRGIDDHKAQGLGQRRHRGRRQQLAEHGFDPRPTGAQTLRHGLVCDRFIEGCHDPCHFAQRLVDATVQQDDPQELLRGFNLPSSGKGFEFPCHRHRLGRQVLQKFLKERLWICGRQLHGHVSYRRERKEVRHAVCSHCL